MNKIKLKIDGEIIVANQNDTILNAAKQNNIMIPTLCHNKKISLNTSCLVCSVKDNKTGKIIPSCAMKVAEGMDIDASSNEIKKMRQTLLNLLLSEHEGDCEAPCTIACPAQASVEEYVQEGKKGNFEESLKIIKERIPLPMSIGRVCPRFCEQDCRRNIYDDAVAINDFKRLAADLHYENYLEELPRLKGEKVAIVGAGPAGFATAYYLRLNGINSVIFEKMPKPGGMLRYGIPEYRLPKNILDTELKHFGKMGIEVICNTVIGKDILIDDLKEDYDAVVVSIGCWKASSMRTKGEELASEGIAWLANIAENNWSGKNPKNTIVIGGGNTAMDCVRTAVRLGSDNVKCVYRRTENEMPAEKIEIEEAKDEGVVFEFLTAPETLTKINDKLVLTCQKMKLGEPDASGRRRPVPIENSSFDIEADTVIAAIGQKTLPFNNIPLNKWGDIDASSDDCNVEENVFACGDCVTGAATVVEAVAGGRKTALAILDFFDNKKHQEPYLINVSRGYWQKMTKENVVTMEELPETGRTPLSLIDINERKTTFKEVAKTFTKDEIKEEGTRCIKCSCVSKQECKLKEHSETYKASTDAFIKNFDDSGYDNRHSDIIHDRNKCIKCGICVKICEEVINKGLLGRAGRGFPVLVTTPYGKKFPEFCSDCLECIKECPVGALTVKK